MTSTHDHFRGPRGPRAVAAAGLQAAPKRPEGVAHAEIMWTLGAGRRCVLIEHATRPAYEVSLFLGEERLRSQRVYARASACVLAEQWRWTVDGT